MLYCSRSDYSCRWMPGRSPCTQVRVNAYKKLGKVRILFHSSIKKGGAKAIPELQKLNLLLITKTFKPFRDLCFRHSGKNLIASLRLPVPVASLRNSPRSPNSELAEVQKEITAFFIKSLFCWDLSLCPGCYTPC